MSRRVVVTGMGVITPVGNSVEEFWAAVKAGQIGIDKITKFDTTGYGVKLAAEVKHFTAKEHMDFKASKRMSAFTQYAVAAAGEAIGQSGLDMEKEDPFMTGVCIGSGIGGMRDLETEEQHLLERGPERVRPMLIPMMISNMAAGNVAITYGLKGKNINVVTACATGSHCIGEAFRSIQCGDADVMVAGGTESAITPLSVAGFMNMTALSVSDDPERASIPFDLERNGFVMGEGAGIVVLEELEHARARGVKILAEVKGYGATCDAYHITSPAPDGSGAARAIMNAMKDASLAPEDIDYINAHGTGTHYNDLFETRAIKAALGEEAAHKVKISSTKSIVGHMLGAAGAVEFITCVKSIQDGYVHPTAGLKVSDPECDLDYVKGQGVHMTVRNALSNSLGFGGHNATLAVSAYEE